MVKVQNLGGAVMKINRRTMPKIGRVGIAEGGSFKDTKAARLLSSPEGRRSYGIS